MKRVAWMLSLLALAVSASAADAQASPGAAAMLPVTHPDNVAPDAGPGDGLAPARYRAANPDNPESSDEEHS
jgi:hypothetical protein